MVKTTVFVFIVPQLLVWIKREPKKVPPKQKKSKLVKKLTPAIPVPVATPPPAAIEMVPAAVPHKDALPPVVLPSEPLQINIGQSPISSSSSSSLHTLHVVADPSISPGGHVPSRLDSFDNMGFTDMDRAHVGLGMDSPSPSPSPASPPLSFKDTIAARGNGGNGNGGNGRRKKNRKNNSKKSRHGHGNNGAPVVVGHIDNNDDRKHDGGDDNGDGDEPVAMDHATAARSGTVYRGRGGRRTAAAIAASGGAGIGTGTATSGISTAIVRMCV